MFLEYIFIVVQNSPKEGKELSAMSSILLESFPNAARLI